MIYTQLFQRSAPGKTVRAGVIGTGHYATTIVAQAPRIPRLEIPVVADIDVEAARRAYLHAGTPVDAIAVCDSEASAARALAQGKKVIVPDAQLMMNLPIDIVAEATGVPEAGAQHAVAALSHGKHVAMVNKEVDVTVGPLLARRAQQAGLVYTPVDGDQHGLLIALVAWARELGLEVVAAGKSRDAEFVFDAEKRTVRCDDHVAHRDDTITLAPEDARFLATMPPGQTGAYVERRRRMLAPLSQMGGFDVTELTIVANATGLAPDVSTLHCPVLRTPEIPEALCPREEGGLLGRRGVIDCVTTLRRADEAGLGGGVFIVVACENDYTRNILVTKGLIANSRGTVALIFRPYHLCGAETPISIMTAALGGLTTGGVELLPRMDIVARARVALAAGETHGNDHDVRLEPLMVPALPVAAGHPLPFHMASGRRLRSNVPAGTVITAAMVEPPADSMLWRLRAEQDELFSGTVR